LVECVLETIAFYASVWEGSCFVCVLLGLELRVLLARDVLYTSATSSLFFVGDGFFFSVLWYWGLSSGPALSCVGLLESYKLFAQASFEP
jgi:hypothetical protein